METKQVVIFGPNLSSAAQKKGSMHVHAADCGDCAKYGPGKPMGGEDRGWKIEAASRQDAVLAIYPPDEFDYEPSDWRDLDDLFVAPCVRWAS